MILSTLLVGTRAFAQIRFTETGGGSDFVSLQAPASVPSSFTWTLPDSDGSANQCLATNGSGTLFWLTGGGGTGSGSSGMAWRSTSLTPALSTWTDVSLNTGDSNLSGVSHSTSTNPERLTVQNAGTYLITYSIASDTTAVSTNFARITVNGSVVTGSQTSESANGSWNVSLNGSVLAALNANDYVTLQFMTNFSGNKLNTATVTIHATGGSSASQWTTSGSDILFSGGNVGIGTTSPSVALDVGGGVRAGSSTAVTSCGSGAAAGEGTQRYNYTTHSMEYCNGTDWVTPGSQSLKSQVFTSSGTFTTPAGTNSGTKFKFTVVGGGGGGSGAGSGVFGTGGGGGAAAIYYGSGVNSGTGVTVTVGAAGTAGSSGGNGGDGGLSRIVFNGTTVTANGGGGGDYNAAEDAVATATNGTINMTGGRGSYAFGNGGSSLMGAGGPVGVNNAAGTAGSGYGAGGGGGSTGIGHSGGAGAPGIVLVEWVQ